MRHFPVGVSEGRVFDKCTPLCGDLPRAVPSAAHCWGAFELSMLILDSKPLVCLTLSLCCRPQPSKPSLALSTPACRLCMQPRPRWTTSRPCHLLGRML